MQQEREYHTLRRNDGSVVVYDTLDAPALAAEVERLNNLANHLSDVIEDERTKSKNRKDVNGILSRRNKKLEAEVAHLKDSVQCTYCEAVFAIDNPLQFEHWRECTHHPARIEMEQLRAQVEAMREALKAAYHHIGGIPIDRIDYRDADGVLAQIDAALGGE